MLGVSGLVERSGDGGATPHQGGGAGAGGGAAAAESINRNDNSVIFGDDENGRIIDEGERNSAGNRWPRQETLALLKIRSDMDVAFRDSSVKGPLWDEVSRKLGELGFHRSAKKCKEKFENVYKYHRRTKEGRSTKSDGKTYRFFDQLEALDQNHPSFSPVSPPPPPPPPRALPSSAVPTMAMPVSSNPPIVMSHFNHLATVSSSLNPTTHTDATSPNVFTITPSGNNPTMVMTTTQATSNAHGNINNSHVRASSLPNFRPTTSSSSTSSDEELQGRQTHRKRKWKDFFEGLMKEVVERQEQLQKKFLEAIEKREHDRMAREEAWKMQEMARLNREHEILVQERSMAAAKDTAVIAFLQKLSDQTQLFQPQPDILQSAQPPRPIQVIQQEKSTQARAPHVQQIQTQGPLHQQLPPLKTKPPPDQALPARAKAVDAVKPDNGNHSSASSRWPKAEVQALINLRTNLDLKYQESGPKGPLWEEISSGMKRLGYNRNPKRCKEKWENINKYFKKVKESNKQRPEDSKTCPYYHLLDALYKDRNKTGDGGDIFPGYGLSSKSDDAHSNNPSANLAPLMVQPEQQWPPPLQGNVGTQNAYGKKEEEEEDEVDDEDLEDEDDEGDEEDDNGATYEIVPNKQQASAGSMSATE